MNSQAPITPENASERIARVMFPDVYPIIVDLERSEGNRLYDSRGGRYFLDCFSYVASNPIGHNHPKMFDSAFEKKLLRAARNKPSSSDFYTLEKAEFVDAFERLAMPAYMRHLFLVEGGAVAVENAMKAAFDWKVRLNLRAGAKDERGSKIIHFQEAFHGRCGYTLSVTNTADPRKTKYFPKFDWPRITNPKISFPLDESSTKAVAALEAKALEEIDHAFQIHGDDIAAIILETIQGEGGDNQFRREFHHALRKVADERNVMLIYDEIQSGCGLTGKMWAVEHYGIEPDIICFGKKTQVCGMMLTRRIEEVENHVFAEASRINSTWGGNLVDMVRAQRYLEVIHEERLVENARDVGAYLIQSLHSLQEGFPRILSNARGLGLMCAIDASTIALRDQIVQAVYERGAIILKCGVNSLRFRPALIFTRSDVDNLTGILTDALRSVSA
ncbi:MAG: L-lysine 6-transaminase [Bdellovibrionota bacterium]